MVVVIFTAVVLAGMVGVVLGLAAAAWVINRAIMRSLGW